jgi:hypothetical protein
MKPKSKLFAALTLTALTLVPCGATVTLVSEDFSGDSTTNLNGTTATTFSSDIITAGGSDAWSAGSTFKEDGTVAGYSGSAGLYMGTYIDDTKGTAAGLFTLSGTISNLTGSGWVGLTFYTQTLTTSKPVWSSNQGVGVAIRRIGSGSSTEFTYFDKTPGGTGDTNTNWTDYGTGDVTFTVVLDLTDWNGVDNYGSLDFYQNGTIAYSTEIDADYDFSYVGFSASSSPTGTVSNFSLTQIPEPSSFALLMGLSAGILLVTRRRR